MAWAIFSGLGMNQSCIGWLNGTAGHIRTAQAAHGGIQVGEGIFGDRGGDLPAVAAGQVVLVDDQRFAGLRTDSRMVCRSTGYSVRRSTTSTSMPSPASFSAACRV